jgi:tetratricopeptide (TPR) repeat protein
MRPVKPEVPGESYLLANGRIVSLDDVETMSAELAVVEPDPEKQVELLFLFAGECFEYRRFDSAVRYLAKIVGLAQDDGIKAHCFLETGRAHEKKRDFQAAANAYRQGLAYPPAWTRTWYFLNNNLGYSLNQLGSFSEAEGYCRTAIAFQPHMYNAHKNLGVSLQGQGRFVEAAGSLLEATRIAPSDRRALGRLEELLTRHPEVGRDHPEILDEVQSIDGRRVGPASRPM